jgi:hypothetical protein
MGSTMGVTNSQAVNNADPSGAEFDPICGFVVVDILDTCSEDQTIAGALEDLQDALILGAVAGGTCVVHAAQLGLAPVVISCTNPTALTLAGYTFIEAGECIGGLIGGRECGFTFDTFSEDWETRTPVGWLKSPRRALLPPVFLRLQRF